MEKIIEEKVIDMLSTTSVSIITEKFIELDGVKNQVGERHRKGYANSESDRADLQESEPQEIAAAILTIWGDEPLVFPTVTEEQTTQEGSQGEVQESQAE